MWKDNEIILILVLVIAQLGKVIQEIQLKRINTIVCTLVPLPAGNYNL